jgi:hypothetical protein
MKALRIAGWVLLVPVWAAVAFICIDSLGGYTETGTIIALCLIMAFALWAWWYSEDRDRRQVRRADSNGHPDGAAVDGG